MTNALRTAIADLATTFAAEVTAAIRASSLDDILALTVEDSRAPSRPRSATTQTRPSAGPGAPAASAAVRAPASRVASASKNGKARRVARRSAEDVETVLELVVALLKSTKDGLRSQQIRQHLGVNEEELSRVLKAGLTTKALRSKGQRGSAVYAAT